jgi:transcriptional regulator with XRE-family HTH domain
VADPLGVMLSGARSRLGWSLRDAERATGVPNAHLSQIETGKIERPSVAVLARLAKAYGIPAERLAEAAGHRPVTQRLVLAGGYPGGVWTCAGCRAELTEGRIAHTAGCPEVSGDG